MILLRFVQVGGEGLRDESERLHPRGGAHRERLRRRLTLWSGGQLLGPRFAPDVLAVYIGVDAGISLLGGEKPDTSVVGLVLSILSLLIMPATAFAQHRTGRSLGSRAVVAAAVETWVCSYLSLHCWPASVCTWRSAGRGPTPSPRSPCCLSSSGRDSKRWKR